MINVASWCHRERWRWPRRRAVAQVERRAVNTIVRLFDQGLKLFELHAQRRMIANPLSKSLFGAVTECETPIHRSPIVEPQTIFFHDGGTNGL